MDAIECYDKPLTKARMFNWHASLFPTGRSGMHKIIVGNWRDGSKGPMQVVSGPIGREAVHYEAPAFDRLDTAMEKFIKWFNESKETDLVIKSALAHFWFITIHPFEDGNGRIARVIADMALARSEKTSQRFYSMSSQIQKERSSYYNTLEECQKGTLDITLWIEWFLKCLKRSINSSESIIENVLVKARFWEAHSHTPLNNRQLKIINRLLNGFEGKLTSSKWGNVHKIRHSEILITLLTSKF